MIFLSMLLIAQIIAQLFTLAQLSKVTGKVTAKNVHITSYTSGSKFRQGSANYSLIITLDSRQIYNVYLDNENWNISNIIQLGDTVTIYNPTLAYNILSLDFLDYGSRVSQLELRNQVLYSFGQHKRHQLPFICFLLVAILPCYYVLYKWCKSDLISNFLKTEDTH